MVFYYNSHEPLSISLLGMLFCEPKAIAMFIFLNGFSLLMIAHAKNTNISWWYLKYFIRTFLFYYSIQVLDINNRLLIYILYIWNSFRSFLILLICNWGNICNKQSEFFVIVFSKLLFTALSSPGKVCIISLKLYNKHQGVKWYVCLPFALLFLH